VPCPTSPPRADSDRPSVHAHAQLYELLRKRWIASSRDLKGLFFQIIFPAIQIILILAILTVQVTLTTTSHRMQHIVLPRQGRQPIAHH